MSKEGKGFLPDKIGRTKILKTRVFIWEGKLIIFYYFFEPI
jgi:hypothetical protein